MTKHKQRKTGFMFLEIMISLAIIGLILVALAMGMNEFRKMSRVQLLKQQCIAAGQSQLESIAAGEGEIGEEDIKRLWPEVAVEVVRSPGVGPWEGLTLVEVAARGTYFDETVEVHLFRYMKSESDC